MVTFLAVQEKGQQFDPRCYWCSLWSVDSLQCLGEFSPGGLMFKHMQDQVYKTRQLPLCDVTSRRHWNTVLSPYWFCHTHRFVYLQQTGTLSIRRVLDATQRLSFFGGEVWTKPLLYSLSTPQFIIHHCCTAPRKSCSVLKQIHQEKRKRKTTTNICLKVSEEIRIFQQVKTDEG